MGWYDGRDQEGTACRWLLLNGGGQHLSSEAMRMLRINGTEETNSNLLVSWTRKNIQLYDAFILLLCGTATKIATSASQSYGSSRRRKRTMRQERSLQILEG